MGIEQIYTEVLREHTNSKHNKHHIISPTAKLSGVNPSCGDEIELELRLQNGIIEDAGYTGKGCAISQASASIMIDLIKGKPVEEAMKLAETFFGMIKHEITEDEKLEVLEDAVALKDIAHMPARVKCAVLSWHTLKECVEQSEEK
ncbi:SUF system NifU family Fe-S cluster assembly protein [Anaerocolumna sp. AGMB13025]|jgi:nitrogen fixation protein NifU and related proteins|uniref:Fe-S cluster assembly sulfur transfer protein SufU n=1 Tax=Anaerocolumna sp. AGMB13025 TaxID=3039116 RepID=UPI00241FCF02|nr:SUF system NifU family Fe-S cluster assembly protein [Anaerocolumna sp. AGMB13025]WFR55290.1 SUF system NifU family Fe-S cluster assembly protein [Anaerocolumna sp. AGMB13025]